MSIRKYFIRERAILKDDLGTTVTTGRIKRTDNKFYIGERAYNVIRSGIYYHEDRGLLFTTRHYFYNINNSNPLSFDAEKSRFAPVVDPELYKKLLENEILVKLNSVPGGWLKNIHPAVIIVAVIILAMIVYAVNSGMIK